MMSSRGAVKVAALTGGKNVPSARFRVRQLIPSLSKHGVEVREFVPLVSKYPPERKYLRLAWGIAALAVRIPSVLATHRYDVVLFQRELVSTFVTLEPLTKRPRVLDVDDAIYLHRGGRFAERLAQSVDLVICGNDFLADRFSKWNKNVTVIPTAIDTHRFVPLERPQQGDLEERYVIGWTGTSSNFKYLYSIETALKQVMEIFPDVVLRVIADKKPSFRTIPEKRVQFIPWSPENEVKGVQSMTVGIMPLADGEWEKGKCSYKMLQYMACGVPVVVSPVGMNAQILALGEVGLAASFHDEWVEALRWILVAGREVREKMGREGRRVAEAYFSVEVIAPRLAQALKGLV